MKKIILFVVLIVGSVILRAQQKTTSGILEDSLRSILKSEIPDTTRINTLNSLSVVLESKSKEKAFETTQQALAIAKNNDHIDFLCKSYSRLGDISRIMGDNKKSLAYFDSVFYLLKTNALDSVKYSRKYKFQLATAMTGRANVLSHTGKTEEALGLLIKSLKIWEQVEGNNEVIPTLTTIGTLFFYQGKLEDALNYYKQALEFAEKQGNKRSISTTLGNVGIAYGASGNLDKAIEHFEKQLSIAEEIKSLEVISTALGNLGEAYKYKNDYQTALKYAVRSLELAEEGKNKRVIGYANEIIGSIHTKLKNYDMSLEYYFVAEEIAKEIDEKSLLKTLYERITKIYILKEDYSNALAYQGLLITVKDSLFNEKSNKQITEMQTKYETGQKEKENELLKKESEVQELRINRQKITIYVGTGGLILILALAGVIFRSYRQKQQDNIKLMEKNAIIRAKTKEIHKKNQQITDSIDYAQRIQQAVLPDKPYIESIFPESFIFFRPKDRVSGDFYWMHKEGDQVLFAAADCTGHGVPGAFMSLICTDLLNNIMLDGIYTPSIILEELGNRLVSHLKQKQEAEDNDSIKDALDIALCNYNTTTKELVYSGAHNSLYLVRDNELKEYKADKLHIGIDRKENSEFTNHTISTQTGDIIYMFSDGFVDQQGGEKGKKFYYPPFRKLLLENHTKQMEDQKENLGTTITNWIGNREQIDDMLIFGVKF